MNSENLLSPFSKVHSVSIQSFEHPNIRTQSCWNAPNSRDLHAPCRWYDWSTFSRSLYNCATVFFPAICASWPDPGIHLSRRVLPINNYRTLSESTTCNRTPWLILSSPDLNAPWLVKGAPGSQISTWEQPLPSRCICIDTLAPRRPPTNQHILSHIWHLRSINSCLEWSKLALNI